MISLKGSKVEWTYYDEMKYHYVTESGTVISEPYPKISSSYGSPERSGLVTSNTSSITCVVVLSDDGGILTDIPVDQLNIKVEEDISDS